MENLLEKYVNSPKTRGLLQLVLPGIAGALDVTLETTFNNIRAERIRTFFDELSKGEIELTDEIIQSEDFLHCFFATTKAALNTRRREKIVCFSRLLKSALTKDRIIEVDSYEESLTILDELSYRELLILLLLSQYELEYPQLDGENDLIRAHRFWGVFVNDLVTKFDCKVDEIDSMLIRLERTGCYKTFKGLYYSDTGGQGKLTPLFYRFKELIEDKIIYKK